MKRILHNSSAKRQIFIFLYLFIHQYIPFKLIRLRCLTLLICAFGMTLTFFRDETINRSKTPIFVALSSFGNFKKSQGTSRMHMVHMITVLFLFKQCHGSFGQNLVISEQTSLSHISRPTHFVRSDIPKSSATILSQSFQRLLNYWDVRGGHRHYRLLALLCRNCTCTIIKTPFAQRRIAKCHSQHFKSVEKINFILHTNFKADCLIHFFRWQEKTKHTKTFLRLIFVKRKLKMRKDW